MRLWSIGSLPFGHDKPHTIAPFAQTERPFYFNPVHVVLIFLFLVCGRDSNRSSQTEAGQAYPMLFSVPTVLAGAVDLVCKDSLRIVSGTFPEAFRGLLQGGSLVIRVEGYLLDPSIAFRIQTQVKFCAEFHRSRNLAPDYGAQPWLADIHDTFCYRMHLMVVHILLLSIHFQDDQKLQHIFPVGNTTFRHKLL